LVLKRIAAIQEETANIKYIPFNTPSTAVFILMNSIRILEDGSIANPAIWKQWMCCVGEILDAALWSLL
jgi:hypothetical protein